MPRRRLLAVGLALAALAAPSGAGALDRSTADRPDDFGGPQVHFVYAVPLGGQDRQYDVDGEAARSARQLNAWLAGQTGGPNLREDTYHGEVDVTFLPLFENDPLISSSYNPGLEMNPSLVNAGLDQPGKIYAVYYDGSLLVSGAACGVADLPGTHATTTLVDRCGGFNAGITRVDYVMAHEIFHTLGIPHVTDDPRDVMYVAPGSYSDWSGGALVDPGRDSYWSVLMGQDANGDTNPYMTLTTYHRLTLTVAGDEIVDADPPPLACDTACAACPPTCTLWYPEGKQVSLFPEGSGSAVLAGWGGDCSGRGACTVTMTADHAVTATFVPTVALAVKVKGKGSVRVAGQGTCRKTCSYDVQLGAPVKVTAVPAKGYRFARWSRKACGARRTCVLPMRSRAAVTAFFKR